MLTNSLRFVLLALVMAALTYAAITVDRWHSDSVTLSVVLPDAKDLRTERDALNDQVRELEATNAEQLQHISNQNHAVELAEASANSAKAQQELARAYAATLEVQKSKRISQLEKDLADATKTVTDMLDNNWRQPR